MIRHCPRCGEEVTEGAKYCSSCGHPIDNNIDIDFTKKEEEPVVDTGPYKVFAIIGYVYGFASLAFCWCPYMFFAMIPGIISARSSPSNTLKVDLANFCNTSNVLSIADLRSCSP